MLGAVIILHTLVTVCLNICVHGGCLSREQFLASLDQTKTLVFEAQLVQLTVHSAPTHPAYSDIGQDAFVRVRKIIRQPSYSWQMSPGNLAHVRGIRPRTVDPYSCLPKLIVDRNYLWIAHSGAVNGTEREASLSFYPGGLFDLELESSKHTWEAGNRLLLRRPPDIPQQDAAYVPFTPSRYPNPIALHRKSDAGAPCEVSPCPIHLDPVCGTDGAVYQNPCFLQQRSCEQRLSAMNANAIPANPMWALSIDRSNRCRTGYTYGKYVQESVLCPSSNLCSYGAVCLPNSTSSSVPVQNFFPSCDCRHLRCSTERPSPVCATDGETYANECYLKKSMCVSQQLKRIRYYGTCASNPCLGHSCRWPGERCEVDETGQPKCVCPETCPNVVIPVCGSDGMTYDSHCHLERTACLKMRDIWVVYAGQCSEEPQCQSLGLYCQGYEICSRVQARQNYNLGRAVAIQSETSDQATIASCVCPVCPEKGLGEKVCGTDGRTYRSECHLRAHACQYQLYEVKVRSRGPCDACSNKQCKYYAICQRNMDGEPQCICPTDCPYPGTGGAVCGTDGETYANECHLKVRSCAEQRDVFVASEGPCKKCPRGCPLGSYCWNGQCQCREACPDSNGVEPEVCGTDGRMYRNECELKRQACVQQTSVEIDPSGDACGGREMDAVKRTVVGAPPQADQIPASTCTCNKLGSLSEYCDQGGECHCKPGTGGDKCDHCLAGYWGMQNGHQCVACFCHPYGSVGETCDQHTGQCDCRQGVLGRQCSICPNDERLERTGCKKVNDFTGLQVEPPPGPDSVINENLSPDAEPTNQKLAGRMFSSQTTLLVRAPASLDQPVTVEMLINPSNPNGILLQYRSAPTEQEQMLVHNLQDHQFSLLLSGGRVECNYLDGRFPNRLLFVRSRRSIRLNSQHTIRAGVAQNRPWLQVDSDTPTTLAEVGTRWISGAVRGSLHIGGYGTIVIGRPVLSMAQSSKALSGALPTQGFTGCLLRLHIQTGLQGTQHEVDLISGDRTYLAWIGVDRLPSGLYEAPICTALLKTERDKTDDGPLQADARPTARSCESVMPCRNGATCVSRDRDQYECVCLPGWQGKLCEEVVTVIPQFRGNSFVRLPGPSGRQAMRRKRLRLALTVLITKAPGLMLYIPPSGVEHTGPFIAVYVDDQNYLVVVCRVGGPAGQQQGRRQSRIIQLRYEKPLTLQTWHTITIDKLAKLMLVRVDQQETQKILLAPNQFGRMRSRLRQQNFGFDLSKSPIYLGGYLFDADPIEFMDIHQGFSGAVQKVVINGAEAVLGGPPLSANLVDTQNPLSKTEFWHNTSQWQGTPCGPLYNPCHPDRPDNVCRPQGDKATCACSTPLQLIKILAAQNANNLDAAEQTACEQRQKEIQLEVLNKHSKKLDLNGMQYDEFSPGDRQFNTPRKRSSCVRSAIRFNGSTSLRFSKLVKSIDDYNLRLQLQTTNQHGLLLLMLELPVGQRAQSQSAPTNQRELTVIAMRNGRIEYSIHTVLVEPDWSANQLRLIHGRMIATPLQLRSGTLVNDGKCHGVQAVRSHQKATLLIDDIMTPGEFIPHTSSAGTDNLIFLGGAPINIVGFPWEYHQNMTGCMGDMYVNEQKIDILHSSQVQSTTSVQLCG